MRRQQANSNNQHFCVGCEKTFMSSRAINALWQRNKECSEACNFTYNDIQKTLHSSNSSSLNSEAEIDIYEGNQQYLLENNERTFNNFRNEQNGCENSLPAKIELLKILNTAKAPLYLYDHIMAWTKKAVNIFDVDFGVEINISREKLPRIKN